jgi:hypothetical protein
MSLTALLQLSITSVDRPVTRNKSATLRWSAETTHTPETSPIRVREAKAECFVERPLHASY